SASVGVVVGDGVPAGLSVLSLHPLRATRPAAVITAHIRFMMGFFCSYPDDMRRPPRLTPWVVLTGTAERDAPADIGRHRILSERRPQSSSATLGVGSVYVRQHDASEYLGRSRVLQNLTGPPVELILHRLDVVVTDRLIEP